MKKKDKKPEAGDRVVDTLKLADVLVVGATGYLGGKVVDHLLAMGKQVRVLVRPGSNPSALVARGANVVEGDLTKRETLDQAVTGVSALITTAQGYSLRKKADTIAGVGIEGHRNLIDAARNNGQPIFVYTSALNCQQAVDNPCSLIFAKWVIEQELRKSGLPFVIIRSGSAFDILVYMDQFKRNLQKSRYMAAGWTDSHEFDQAISK